MEEEPLIPADKSDVLTAVYNERVKLTANWMSSVAVAVFAIGALAPLFAALYGTQPASVRMVVGTGICILAALALHYWARRSLKDIRR